MRNMFAIIIGVFIAVCIGGYGITWYSQAASTKRAIEAAIAKINQKQTYITYESIEYSGFPNNVNVSIVKPHFKGRADQIMLAANAITNPNAAPKAMEPWDEDILLDGKITVGINALSDHYTIAVSGSWSDNATISGVNYASIHEQVSDFNCTLHMARETSIFDTLWNFGSLQRDGKAMLHDFRMLDCNTAGQKTIDTATKEPLTIVGPIRIYTVNTPQNDVTQLRFYTKFTDMEISKAGDKFMVAYVHAASPETATALNYSDYGKQNLEIDFTYMGPSEFKPDTKNAQMEVALNKFDMANNVYTLHNSFHYNNLPAPNSRASNLSFKTESTFGPQYNTVAKESVHNFIINLYTNPSPYLAGVREIVQKYKPDEVFAVVTPALPNYTALGKLVLGVDGNFRGTADFTAGDYTLDGLEISTALYGITGKGALKMASGAPAGGNVQLSCANCLSMIDDLADFHNRVQHVVAYFEPSKAVPTIDPAQTGALKQFLSILSLPAAEPTDKTTLGYVIVMNGPNITINNKSMADVTALFNEYIRPVIRPVEPAPAPAPAH